MAKSPINNRIGAVFVPVSDVGRAAAWYSTFVDQPVAAASHEGRIYDVPMQGEVSLILDGHKPVSNSSQPLCFFWTADIQETQRFLLANDVEVLRAIEDIGSVLTLTFKDPDGNLLMVCQPNR